MPAIILSGRRWGASFLGFFKYRFLLQYESRGYQQTYIILEECDVE
jgi:hypothetical protein